MSFSSYLEINMLIDLLLVVVFAIVVLPRAPKLFVLVLVLNLAQYLVHVPLNPANSSQPVTIRWAWDAADLSPEATQSPYQGQRRLEQPEAATATNPVAMILRTPEIFAEVQRAMSGHSIQPQVAASGPNLDKVTAEEASMRVLRDRLAIAAPSPSHSSSSSRRVSLSFSQIMTDALYDPDAMWLGMRCFWLAAAFFLFIQRPLLGAVAACTNLLPVAFLARLLPALTGKIGLSEAYQSAQIDLRNPETIREWLAALWSSHGMVVLAICLILAGFGLALMMLGRFRHRARVRRLEAFLDPSRFAVRLNGSNHTFELDGANLVVGDLRLPLHRIKQDPAQPARWTLGRATVIEFVNPQAPASATPAGPAYSFRRKK